MLSRKMGFFSPLPLHLSVHNKICEIDMDSAMNRPIAFLHHHDHVNTPGRRQSKTLIPSTNVDQKSLETEFSNRIAVSSDF